jgi:hypothetical protein
MLSPAKATQLSDYFCPVWLVDRFKMVAKTSSRNVLYFFLLFVASSANSQDDFLSNFSDDEIHDPLYSETSTYSGIPEAAPYLDMNDLTEKERKLAETEQTLEESENLPDVSTSSIIKLLLVYVLL